MSEGMIGGIFDKESGHYSEDTAKDNDVLAEFQALFYSEEVCAEYLVAKKWPNGFSCSRCSHSQATRIDTRRLPLYGSSEVVYCHVPCLFY